MRKRIDWRLQLNDSNGKKESEWSTFDQLATKYKKESHTTEQSPEKFSQTRLLRSNQTAKWDHEEIEAKVS